MKSLTFVVLIVAGFAGLASPKPTKVVTDKFFSDFLRYYAAATSERNNGLFEYDLCREEGRSGWKLPPGRFSKKWGGQLVVICSSTRTSEGLTLSIDRKYPSVEILRVKFWWPQRPKTVLSSRKFVKTILWPALNQCQTTFLDPDSVPENARLWNLVEENCLGFSYVVQDINLDRTLLQSMRKRYPNAPPWGIYVETIPASSPARPDRKRTFLARETPANLTAKGPTAEVPRNPDSRIR